ncbi:MAG: hypothetical protein R3C17_07315 [Planctomycetaceae bacterium]
MERRQIITRQWLNRCCARTVFTAQHGRACDPQAEAWGYVLSLHPQRGAAQASETNFVDGWY